MGVKRDNPNAFKNMTERLEGLGAYEVKVGWFEGAKEENGTPSAYVAAIQEFGHGKIPPRLGMRETLEKQRTSTVEFTKAAANKVLQGIWNGAEAAEALGLKAHKDFYERINSNPAPPLSQLTLALRKRREDGKPINGRIIGEIYAKLKAGDYVPLSSNTQALVDTGNLLDSLDSKVEHV